MTGATCLITARAGSSLADKCLRPILGMSSLDRAIEAVSCAGIFDKFYVSTDCPKILEACKHSAFETIQRPDYLSGDTASHSDVINHSLNIFPAPPDYLCIVLPNNPFITPDLLVKSFNLLIGDPAATSVIPVYQDNDHHPFRSKILDRKGRLRSFGSVFNLHDVHQLSSNRQSLQPSFFPAHNFWFLRVRLVQDSSSSIRQLRDDGDPPWGFFGPQSLPIFMQYSHDIHTEIDLTICENLLRQSSYDNQP
jgi:CMP-N,N'-diacetyllegionaminic acid synthase